LSTPRRQPWSEASIRRRFVTPELISGIVLVSVVIAIADESDGIFDVFAVTILSVLVIWATSVFAHTVAAQRRRDDKAVINVSIALRIALGESTGYLIAAILPTVFLLIGLLGGRSGEVAYWTALWIQVVLLGVAGWFAFGGRRIAWYWRLCGALATAALGILAILLKILVS
jgi:hypothetical protein